MCSAPTLAQDVTEGACSQQAIDDAMSALIADYLQARTNAETAEAALQAVQIFEAATGELIAGCAQTAEATPTVEDEAADTPTITMGKYQLTWDQPTKRCAADEAYAPALIDRPILVHYDAGADTLIASDFVGFDEAVFERDADQNYRYSVEQAEADGTVYTANYVLTVAETGRITGVEIDQHPGGACEVIESGFQMALVEANIICLVGGSSSGSNLRKGPGTDFPVAGSLSANEVVDVIGQHTDSAGTVWWQLANDGWIRHDVAAEIGDCLAVPTVS
jgi:hypothetical protein